MVLWVGVLCAGAQEITETQVKSGEEVKAGEAVIPVVTEIFRVQEHNEIIEKAIEKIDTPLAGIDEVLRQKKMHDLYKKLKKNQEIMNRHKEYLKQKEIIRQHQRVLDIQRQNK